MQNRRGNIELADRQTQGALQLLTARAHTHIRPVVLPAALGVDGRSPETAVGAAMRLTGRHGGGAADTHQPAAAAAGQHTGTHTHTRT